VGPIGAAPTSSWRETVGGVGAGTGRGCVERRSLSTSSLGAQIGALLSQRAAPHGDGYSIRRRDYGPRMARAFRRLSVERVRRRPQRPAQLFRRSRLAFAVARLCHGAKTDICAAGPACPMGFPQPPQNLAAGSFSKPQAGHCAGSGDPHSAQKRRVPAFSAMQLRQRIQSLGVPTRSAMRIPRGRSRQKRRFNARDQSRPPWKAENPGHLRQTGLAPHLKAPESARNPGKFHSAV